MTANREAIEWLDNRSYNIYERTAQGPDESYGFGSDHPGYGYGCMQFRMFTIKDDHEVVDEDRCLICNSHPDGPLVVGE